MVNIHRHVHVGACTPKYTHPTGEKYCRFGMPKPIQPETTSYQIEEDPDNPRSILYHTPMDPKPDNIYAFNRPSIPSEDDEETLLNTNRGLVGQDSRPLMVVTRRSKIVYDSNIQMLNYSEENENQSMNNNDPSSHPHEDEMEEVNPISTPMAVDTVGSSHHPSLVLPTGEEENNMDTDAILQPSSLPTPLPTSVHDDDPHQDLGSSIHTLPRSVPSTFNSTEDQQEEPAPPDIDIYITINFYDELLDEDDMTAWQDAMIIQLNRSDTTERKLTDEEENAIRTITMEQAKKIRAVVEYRNGLVADYNRVASAVLRCNTAMYLLGSTGQCIAVFFYLVKYVTKDANEPTDSLAIIADASKKMKEFPPNRINGKYTTFTLSPHPYPNLFPNEPIYKLPPIIMFNLLSLYPTCVCKY